MKILIALALVACTRPPVYPLPENPHEARAALVDAECGEPLGGDNPWDAERAGAAVLADDRVAITASHVIACPEIPTVHITLADGRVRMAHVTYDDGEVARLEPVSLEGWGIGAPAAQVMIPPWTGPVCEDMPRAERCGDVTASSGRLFTFEVPGRKGHSGAGVWYGEWLVGVTQGINANGSTVASSL